MTLDAGFGKVFLISYEGRIIGGIMCPFFPGKGVYEWYVCGLDEEYKSSGVYPSVLATWAAIDFAMCNDFELFDFMGVGIPGVPYGVRVWWRNSELWPLHPNQQQFVVPHCRDRV